MRTKKWIKIALIVAAIGTTASQLGTAPTRAHAAAATGSPSEWAKQEIQDAISSGLIPYGLTNSYRLALTRQEFCEMAVQLYEVLTDTKPADPKQNPFRDTNNPRIGQAYELGIIKGTSPNTFSPKANVTREQLALMLYNTLAKAGFQTKLQEGKGTPPKFADDKQLAQWSRNAIGMLAGNGIMKGDVSGNQLRFQPRVTTTREQAIVLVYRIFSRFGTYFVNDEEDLLGAAKQSLPVVIKNEQMQEIYTRARAVLAEIIRPGMTEYERELAIHDYILQHTAYDYENYKNDTVPPESYSVYGVLMNGIAVCQGYAGTADLLLSMAGIESHIVIGTADGGSHAWNKVKIDGAYYNLDVTWDDPVPDVAGRLNYGYFNVTDEALREDHAWKDTLPQATANTFNYYVINGLTVNNQAEFEARISSAVEARLTSVTIKRTYKDEQGPSGWEALLRNYGDSLASYSYTMDNSGVVSFKFKYR
ncbi:S-layer homology domain-containing protein [Paenibacillus lignilyticus]|uniref:S-layer homology domain-containing protein n=1 Tax=Paenibacillus lignilyticus TaxID=1172615 RepID=A0ABS5CKJ9_9BACL|nr:S-layer homology domain-containing protein [Paenibacillus lignilyticus]MBP3966383.1 S-layer homology domain-containing protein [Paenibacillus lignilyticus]